MAYSAEKQSLTRSFSRSTAHHASRARLHAVHAATRLSSASKSSRTTVSCPESSSGGMASCSCSAVSCAPGSAVCKGACGAVRSIYGRCFASLR